MQKIRRGIFETNSSSAHSITVDADMKLNNVPLPNEDGSISIGYGDFGWEIENYNDFGNKAAYLAIYIRDWCGELSSEYKDIFEGLIKKITQCETVTYSYKFWDQIEKSYIGINDEVCKYYSNLGEGSIDHQSVEDNDYHYLFEDIELLTAFLFSHEAELNTDNDNH